MPVALQPAPELQVEMVEEVKLGSWQLVHGFSHQFVKAKATEYSFSSKPRGKEIGRCPCKKSSRRNNCRMFFSGKSGSPMTHPVF